MTKKDYILIASVLKDFHKSEQMGWGFDIDNAFADILASKNPRFDKEKFLKACGVECHHSKMYLDSTNTYCLKCK